MISLTPALQTPDELSLRRIGQGLSRPESVLATSNGDIWTSHWTGGGVSRLDVSGTVTHHLPKNPIDGVQPNGIALLPDGSFLLASLGSAPGIWCLSPNRELRPFIQEAEGRTLPPTNFVSIDPLGRIWVSVSTQMEPRAKAYRPDVADGFIVLHDKSGTRIVAEGLGYANEVLVSPCGSWLYVNETFARRLSRYQLSASGDLGVRQTLVEFGEGIFPDGLGFDEQGGIWVISIVSNLVLRIAPDGRAETILSDFDRAFVDEVEAAFGSTGMGRPHLDQAKSQQLKNISSIAFSGQDRKTAILGCLLDDAIYRFESPFTGVKPVHWDWSVNFSGSGQI